MRRGRFNWRCAMSEGDKWTPGEWEAIAVLARVEGRQA